MYAGKCVNQMDPMGNKDFKLSNGKNIKTHCQPHMSHESSLVKSTALSPEMLNSILSEAQRPSNIKGQLGVPLTVYPWYLFIVFSSDSWG